MEKKVDNIYSRAQKEISEKWDAYMKSHEKKVKFAYDDLQEAIKLGDRNAVKEAKANYERVVKNVTLNNERYKAMVDETTTKLAHTNEVALAYVNDNMAKVYTLNYNDFGGQKIDGYTFALVNEQAIKNLAKTDKLLLPTKKLDIPKDKKWNTKSINAEVLQGILQGESIPKIAKRLEHVSDMNKKSAIRNARTMTTSAENKGRQDSFKKAESDGIVMKRRWVAAHDDRTRAWHLDLHGVEVGVDEPWENEYGKIMYPGDPTADAANVYNCRCAIRAVVKGFKWDQEESKYADLNNKDYLLYNNSASSSGVAVADSCKSMNRDILNSTVSTFNNFGDTYPTVREYLKQSGCKFETMSDGRGIMSAVTNASTDRGINISKVVFANTNENDIYYSSLNSMKNTVMRRSNEKWFMPCSEEGAEMYLASHEYGHIIQNYILNRDNDWSIYKTDKELADAYYDKCKEMSKELIACGQRNGIITDMSESLNNLSRYALGQSGKGIMSDVFAESFANMTCGKPNEWGKTMEIFLKEKGVS